MSIPAPAWRKASRSSSTGGDCVEVADLGGNVGIRDSKNPAMGHFTLAQEAFAGLLKGIKTGKLDL